MIPSTPTVVVVTGEFTDGFMRDDLRILHQYAEVVPLELSRTPFRGGGPLGRLARVALNYGRLAFRLLKYDVRVLVFWFANNRYAPGMAAFAKMMGKKVVVITGGVDAVYVPEIDWGALKTADERGRFARLLSRADSVLPFSDSARRGIEEQTPTAHMRTAYPAVDTRFFVPLDTPPVQQVVTCCYEYHAGNILQKGLDRFVEVARLLPDVPFLLVGNGSDDDARRLQASAPANVRFLPRLTSRRDYHRLLATSKVYAQLSVHEGFGVSVAEAMASGAIPVVADRYSLPEVVGDAGFVAPYGDDAATAAAIRAALDAPESLRQAARQRVSTLFRWAQRDRLFREELARLDPDFVAKVRVELGCGSTGVPGAIGVDMRQTVQTRAVCDVRFSCFRSESADEVYSFCVLEHLDDPYQLMDEVVRVLKPGGRAYLRVPNLGTYSSHLDTTHRYLADLRIWRGMMEGYFEKVKVVPVGTKYRDNPLLTFINQVLVRVFRFNEMAQGWTFVCDRKRRSPSRYYMGWWQEPLVEEEQRTLVTAGQPS